MALDIAAIKMKLAELRASIDASVPGYVGILGLIHQEFRNQPELLYMLDDSEIATVISGLSLFHKVEIAEPKDKKKVTTTRGAKLGADDV